MNDSLENILLKLTSKDKLAIKSWHQGYVSVSEIKSLYHFRNKYYKEKKGSESKFFKKILTGISKCTDEKMYLISIVFENDIPAFAFVSEDGNVLFYSGLMVGGSVSN